MKNKTAASADHILRKWFFPFWKAQANARQNIIHGSQTIAAMVSMGFFITSAVVADQKAKIWTDPQKATIEDADFLLQGEYRSDEKNEPRGAQVIALGSGKFDAYVLEGGLPGAGWMPGMKRLKLHGGIQNGRLDCVSSSGKTKASIVNGMMTITKKSGQISTLNRVERTSPTLAMKAPQGSVVLFDGTSAEQWEKGKIDGGLLAATGATSKKQFGSYLLHVEFRTPYKPEARSQKRGNSGIYHSGRWETQILDSFGLEVQQNECGGIYSIAKPQLNMCLPPLSWQTYDVEFKAAIFDANAKRTAWPRITVRLNGVVIHDDIELSKDFTPSAPLSIPLTTPEGPVHLQDHDNPVMFQNIWIVPRA